MPSELQNRIKSTEFYTWNNYRCTYETYSSSSQETPLLLIHPIGVGLSKNFWHRFCQEWYAENHPNPIYNPDLLGCGESEMPHVAYTPIDWAEQLQYFLETVVQKPVIIVVQGALLPVAIALSQRQPNLVAGLVLAGPPAWAVMTKEGNPLQQKIIWNLLDSPFGSTFYRYARRRKFLQSFSIRQLFDRPDSVDENWLNTLETGAKNPDSRHAVFSFLAGFWRENYSSQVAKIKQPTLVVLGEKSSSISQEGKAESTDERLADYLKNLPQGNGMKISGRNVPPYESTAEFVKATANFIETLEGKIS